MADNIFQQSIVPVIPKILEGERIYVYVPLATEDTPGIASYNKDDFLISSQGQIKIKWPYAYEWKPGLVNIAKDSAGYLKFSDDNNHYLEVDNIKLDNTIDDKIAIHNTDKTAHNDIRNLISTNSQNIATLQTDVTNLNKRITTNELNISKLFESKVNISEINNDLKVQTIIRNDGFNGQIDITANDITNGTIGEIQTRIGLTKSELVLYSKNGTNYAGMGTNNTDGPFLIIGYNNGFVKEKIASQPFVTNITNKKVNIDSVNQNNEYISSKIINNDGEIDLYSKRVDNRGLLVGQSNIHLYYDDTNHAAKLDLETKNAYLKMSTGQIELYTIFPVTGATSPNTKILMTPFAAIYYNNKDDGEIATKPYVEGEINKITAIQIRNIEPNLVITATEETLQTVATQYIVDNYNRQPKDNDGLFITMTNLKNDVIEYAYYNGAWINTGLNGVDLSNYMDLTSSQEAEGTKNFTGILQYKGIEVATINSDLSSIESLDLTNNSLTGEYANNIITFKAKGQIVYEKDNISFNSQYKLPIKGEEGITLEVIDNIVTLKTNYDNSTVKTVNNQLQVIGVKSESYNKLISAEDIYLACTIDIVDEEV